MAPIEFEAELQIEQVDEIGGVPQMVVVLDKFEFPTQGRMWRSVVEGAGKRYQVTLERIADVLEGGGGDE